MPNKNLVSLGKTSSIICKEVFDDGYQPSSEEINEYATHIGINPKTEPHLLYIAKEGLLQAIPPEWQICYNDECGGFYYSNILTKVRQWEHPLDAEYKQKVEQIRKFGTSGHIERDFSEDTSQIDSGIKSLQGDDFDLLTDPSPVSAVAMRKMDLPLQSSGRFLAPLDKRTNLNSPMSLQPIESVRNKRFEITNNITTNPLPSTNQIDLSIKSDSFQDPLPSSSKPVENIAAAAGFKGFTLSGKGSMFLKSMTKKPESDELKMGEKNFRSILRDSSSTDVRSKKVDNMKTAPDMDMDDRKIVRFDLTKISVAAPLKNDESSNDEENVAWDFDETHGDLSDANVDLPMAIKSIKLSNDTSTTSGLINMFEKRNIESGQIKPLYEDTDSESVTSIRSANIVRQTSTTINNNNNNNNNNINNSDKDSNTFRRQTNFDLSAKEGDAAATAAAAAFNVPHFSATKIPDFASNMTMEWQQMQNDIQTKRKSLESHMQNELKQLTNELEHNTNDRKIELETKHNIDVETFKRQLNVEFEKMRQSLNDEHRMAEQRLHDEHKVILAELERDLKTETELLRKDHATKLQQIKEQMKHELEMEKQRARETGDTHLYEKIRCEKRLLEDKYRCLKEKYGRLKAEVKQSLERRNQRREHQQQSITTGSETERTSSNKFVTVSTTNPFKAATKRADDNVALVKDHVNMIDRMCRSGGGATAKYSIVHNQKQCADDTSVSQSDTTISNNYHHHGSKIVKKGTMFVDNGNSDSDGHHQVHNNNNHERDAHERQRKKTFTRMKSASTSRLNTINMKINAPEPLPCTPVESLRRQLQKLDDLEDQFPDNAIDTTYHLRYPFSFECSRERGTISTELEFVRHRIHLERDSVRCAKETLRVKRNNFRLRQREIKHRYRQINRHNIDKMIEDEKELTEMEVNLHHTRALLGEKVIRLRHLEQSLERLCQEKSNFQQQVNGDFKDDTTTISDLSSHSSSGFSSTDLASDTHHGQRKEIVHNSSEIVQTLDSLNNEIREIWTILSQQQQTQGLTPPPSTVLYPDMNWRNSLPISKMFPISDSMDDTQNSTAPNALLCQPIPSLIDRLETYRQLASCRLSTGAADIAKNLNKMPTEAGIHQSVQNCTVNLMERTQDLRDWLKKAKTEHQLLRGGQQTDI